MTREWPGRAGIVAMVVGATLGGMPALLGTATTSECLVLTAAAILIGQQLALLVFPVRRGGSAPGAVRRDPKLRAAWGVAAVLGGPAAALRRLPARFFPRAGTGRAFAAPAHR